jgi:hypothetical protein
MDIAGSRMRFHKELQITTRTRSAGHDGERRMVKAPKNADVVAAATTTPPPSRQKASSQTE